MKLTKIIAGILLVLALGLALLAWQLMRSQNTPAPAAANAAHQAAASAHENATSTPAPLTPAEPAPVMHDVIVLAQPVPAGHKLTAVDVKTQAFPFAVEGTFDTPEQVIGHTTALALNESAPIFAQNLLSGLALQLEPGQRALSIAVNENMAAGHRVRPGDFVDVFVTLGDAQQQSPIDTQNRLLLARTRVLAYGAATVETPPQTPTQIEQSTTPESQPGISYSRGNISSDSSDSSTNNTNRSDPSLRPENAKTAVLAVPLDDVPRLTLAEKYGQLTLALRHPDDLALPDASLFAQLPPALRPLKAKLAKGETLEGIDRAVAGLRFNDLATGADTENRKRAPSAPLDPSTRRANTVDVYNGAAVQTVLY